MQTLFNTTNASMHPQRGGIVLSLLGVVLVISVAAAATVAYLLWQDTDGSLAQLWSSATPTEQATSAPTPRSSSVGDPLLPEFSVDGALQDDSTELTQQLLLPLRAYYATKEERLGTIRVTLSNDVEHTAEVDYELIDTDGSSHHRFFYDRTGADKSGPYPSWEPSLLDVTN